MQLFWFEMGHVKKYLYIMIKRILIISLFASSFYSCNKESYSPSNNGCIEMVIVPVTAHSVKSSDAVIISNLFKQNNISNNNIRYERYNHDTIKLANPPYTVSDYKYVSVLEYLNTLPIFNGYLLYVFKNDKLDFIGGYPSKGTNLNVFPVLKLVQIRQLFLNDLEIQDHKGKLYQDSCFRAEFGYYNLNGGTGKTDEILVKAWKVTPKGREYPIAYYQDNGSKIYYFNGIINMLH